MIAWAIVGFAIGRLVGVGLMAINKIRLDKKYARPL